MATPLLHIHPEKQGEQQARADLEILNQASEKLNAEASDVLSYQVEL